MPFTNYAKDRYFAPKLSQLTACGAPRLSVAPDASAQWIAHFAGISVFRININDPYRQLIFSFLRRVDSAVLEYTEGCRLLEALVAMQPDVSLSNYSRCLYAFEAAIAMTYQALSLAKQLLPGKPRLFDGKDGSVLYRMDRVYNASKHADEFIANGNRFAPGSTLPVWLVSDGVESQDALLTYPELAGEIEALGRVAADLAVLALPEQSPASTSG